MPGGWGTPHPGTYPEVGEVFIQGKTPATAQALLAACEELQVDPQIIRTVNQGFIAPSEVWARAEDNRLAAQGRQV